MTRPAAKQPTPSAGMKTKTGMTTKTGRPSAGNLVVDVHIDQEGAAVTSEPVSVDDISEAIGETWFTGCCRKGHPDVQQKDLDYSLVPIFARDGGTRCAGYRLETKTPAGNATHCLFSRQSLKHVAQRAAGELRRTGVIDEKASIFFELRAEGDSPPSPAAADTRPATADGKPRSTTGTPAQPLALPRAARTAAPLTYRTLSLPAMLERVETTDPDAGERYPHVFYTREALEKAERISRRGGATQPTRETGGVLVGPLCACPETGEMFSVVHDVLEATEADSTTFSLFYTGETWMRIQAVMKAKQAHPFTQHHRILGQTHGHCFLPLDGEPPCEECKNTPDCPRTTAYLSEDDLIWCRAVFGGQPWQLSQIFGLNARGEPVASFFGQTGGSLVKRAFHVVPEAAFNSLLTT